MANERYKKEVIKYVVKKIGKVEGRKKLQKLIFLIDYYNILKGINKDKILGYDFIIYHYGPYSIGLQKDIDELCNNSELNEDIIEDKSSDIVTYEYSIVDDDADFNIPEDLKGIVDGILDQYGNKTGGDLEREVLKLLKLSPAKKIQYFTEPVEKILN